MSTHPPKPVWDRGEPIDPEMLAFTIGDDPVLDRRLVEVELVGSMAHVRGLGRAGLVTEGERDALLETLSALLDAAIAEHAVDTRRVYLTGLSMGGRGSWQLAAQEPQRFAAVAPICGRIPDVPDFLANIAVLKETPIWVFHGAKDLTVPIENSEKLVAALKACGGDVRYTVYPDAGHNSWSAAYGTPALYTWLLQYSLPG